MTTAFYRTGRFVYHNSLELVVVSVCWAVGSMFLLTAGPATLCAYAVIRSLRDEPIDRSLVTVLREHGIAAALIGILPICVGLITVGYARLFVATGSMVSLSLTIAGVYLFSFLCLVVATTLAGFVAGAPVQEALKNGYWWTIRHPTRAVMLLLVSAVVLLGGVVSIVGLVVIVPAIVFSFHAELVWSGRSTTPTG
ncbi:hypothetical protein [Halocatena halophila]|uniref:hypothetical protein n=1 Tax=Halocatena halophila TaxID=2814576 RepID=UPI002ED1B948